MITKKCCGTCTFFRPSASKVKTIGEASSLSEYGDLWQQQQEKSDILSGNCTWATESFRKLPKWVWTAKTGCHSNEGQTCMTWKRKVEEPKVTNRVMMTAAAPQQRILTEKEEALLRIMTQDLTPHN